MAAASGTPEEITKEMIRGQGITQLSPKDSFIINILRKGMKYEDIRRNYLIQERIHNALTHKGLSMLMSLISGVDITEFLRTEHDNLKEIFTNKYVVGPQQVLRRGLSTPNDHIQEMLLRGEKEYRKTVLEPQRQELLLRKEMAKRAGTARSISPLPEDIEQKISTESIDKEEKMSAAQAPIPTKDKGGRPRRDVNEKEITALRRLIKGDAWKDVKQDLFTTPSKMTANDFSVNAKVLIFKLFGQEWEDTDADKRKTMLDNMVKKGEWKNIDEKSLERNVKLLAGDLEVSEKSHTPLEGIPETSALLDADTSSEGGGGGGGGGRGTPEQVDNMEQQERALEEAHAGDSQIAKLLKDPKLMDIIEDKPTGNKKIQDKVTKKDNNVPKQTATVRKQDTHASSRSHENISRTSTFKNVSKFESFLKSRPNPRQVLNDRFNISKRLVK